MKVKPCPLCAKKFRAAGRKGGRAGSVTDKIRAARLATVARAEKALRLTYRGNTLTVAEWSAQTGIPKRTLWRRARKPHYSVEQILNIKTTNHKPTT